MATACARAATATLLVLVVACLCSLGGVAGANNAASIERSQDGDLMLAPAKGAHPVHGSISGIPANVSPPATTTVMYDLARLASTKASLAGAGSPLRPSLATLVGWADYWTNEADHNRTFSVVTKPNAGPSGNIHDFFSLGTYWWPDASKPNGLPYVRKDGIVNPETFLFDSVPLSQMIFAVTNLSLAHYFTNDEKYCDAAVKFIDTWFFDEATKMNPASGLQYAQLIRGLDEGRGIGIIDAKDLAFVPDSAVLLSATGTCTAWSSAKKAGLSTWLQQYVGWLASSPHASAEFAQKNNHGTWFDIQALALSLHVGNTSWSQFLAADALKRVVVQIQPNGTMPMELSRTRSMHYTWWNMMAFFELGAAIERVPGAASLFQYQGPEGQSLQRALDWVAPYTLKNSTGVWPYEEETPFDHGKFYQIFRVASLQFSGATSLHYERMIPQLPGTVDYQNSTINLVWPSKH